MATTTVLYNPSPITQSHTSTWQHVQLKCSAPNFHALRFDVPVPPSGTLSSGSRGPHSSYAISSLSSATPWASSVPAATSSAHPTVLCSTGTDALQVLPSQGTLSSGSSEPRTSPASSAPAAASVAHPTVLRSTESDALQGLPSKGTLSSEPHASHAPSAPAAASVAYPIVLGCMESDVLQGLPAQGTLSSSSSEPPSSYAISSLSSATSWTSSAPAAASIAHSTVLCPTESDALRVLPSQVLKSPTIRKAALRRFQHPLIDAETNSYDIDAVRAQRRVSLARARRYKDAALETVAIKNLQESLLLKRQANISTDFLDLEPQAAVDLARAARDALLAAERLALTRVRETEEYLQALKDDFELAHVHVTEAELQLKKVLSAVEGRGIRIEPTPDFTAGLKVPLPFTVQLSNCDLPGAHSDVGPEAREFEIEFDEIVNGVGSEDGGESEEEGVVWEPDDNALDE